MENRKKNFHSKPQAGNSPHHIVVVGLQGHRAEMDAYKKQVDEATAKLMQQIINGTLGQIARNMGDLFTSQQYDKLHAVAVDLSKFCFYLSTHQSFEQIVSEFANETQNIRIWRRLAKVPETLKDQENS